MHSRSISLFRIRQEQFSLLVLVRTVQSVVEHVAEDSNQEHMGTMGGTTGN